LDSGNRLITIVHHRIGLVLLRYPGASPAAMGAIAGHNTASFVRTEESERPMGPARQSVLRNLRNFDRRAVRMASPPLLRAKSDGARLLTNGGRPDQAAKIGCEFFSTVRVDLGPQECEPRPLHQARCRSVFVGRRTSNGPPPRSCWCPFPKDVSAGVFAPNGTAPLGAPGPW